MQDKKVILFINMLPSIMLVFQLYFISTFKSLVLITAVFQWLFYLCEGILIYDLFTKKISKSLFLTMVVQLVLCIATNLIMGIYFASNIRFLVLLCGIQFLLALLITYFPNIVCFVNRKTQSRQKRND